VTIQKPQRLVYAAGASTSIEDYAQSVNFFQGGAILKTSGGQYLSDDRIVFMLLKMSFLMP